MCEVGRIKTTIYDLLGMVKDGNAPKKIKVTGTTYEYDAESKSYFAHFKDYSVALGGKEDEINLIYNAFNENVEILEESKENIKTIDNYICAVGSVDNMELVDSYIHTLFEQQNQVIDRLNKIIHKINKESDK